MNLVMRSGRPIIAAWFALASVHGALCGDPPASGLEPDPGFQAGIEQAVAAVVRQDDAAPERIEMLRALAGGRRGTLLLQLALYLKESSGTEQSMAGALILHHLAFTPKEKLETILPHLETADPGLRRVFKELLGTIDRRDGGEPDFRFYEARIRKERESPPPALVRYLYEVSPSAAVRSMARIYGGADAGRAAEAGKLEDLRDLLARRDVSLAWSAQDRSRAQAALEALSRDPAWWIRLYVAAILNRDPELATPAMTDRLKHDPDALVRDTFSP